MARTPEAEAALARRRVRSLSQRWHLLLGFLLVVGVLWAAQ